MSLNLMGPGEDGGQDDPAAVGQGVLVVAGGQGAPLLEHVEGAFDDVVKSVRSITSVGFMRRLTSAAARRSALRPVSYSQARSAADASCRS